MTRIAPGPAKAGMAALALAAMLSACSTAQVNGTLNSVHQPVVERTEHVLDLATSGAELAPGERQRLDGWFTALGLGYGDRVSIAGAPAASPARAEIAALVARHGLLLGADGPSAEPASYLAGVRVTVGRSRAYVPNCPDWSAKSTAKLDNSTSPNFGCAVNGNFAAMVADPEHLLKGAEGSGTTMAATASKAIASYRAAEPTGAGGLAEISSQSEGADR